MPAVVIRQRKSWRRRDGLFLYFEVRFSPLYAFLRLLTRHRYA